MSRVEEPALTDAHVGRGASRPAVAAPPPPRRRQRCCIRALPGLPSKISRPAPPLPGVIPGEAGAKRRRRPGTHSAPIDRQRPGLGAAACAQARSIAEWVPDTPASAARGGRSGMTPRLPGFPGLQRSPRIGATPSGPAVSWPRARRHPGRSRSAAEAQTRDPFRTRRQAAAGPRRRRMRAGARSASRNGFRIRPPPLRSAAVPE